MPHKTPATQGKIRLAILFTRTLAANCNKCRHDEHLATEYQIFTCISMTKKAKGVQNLMSVFSFYARQQELL